MLYIIELFAKRIQKHSLSLTANRFSNTCDHILGKLKYLNTKGQYFILFMLSWQRMRNTFSIVGNAHTNFLKWVGRAANYSDLLQIFSYKTLFYAPVSKPAADCTQSQC